MLNVSVSACSIKYETISNLKSVHFQLDFFHFFLKEIKLTRLVLHNAQFVKKHFKRQSIVRMHILCTTVFFHYLNFLSFISIQLWMNQWMCTVFGWIIARRSIHKHQPKTEKQKFKFWIQVRELRLIIILKYHSTNKIIHFFNTQHFLFFNYNPDFFFFFIFGQKYNQSYVFLETILLF